MHNESSTHKDDCQNLLDQLSDYLDGRAAPGLCTEIETHLALCPDCRVVVDTLDNTVKLYRALPESDPPEGAAERLFHVLNIGAPDDRADIGRA